MSKQKFKKGTDENLRKRSANAYTLFNRDINKFVLLLQKCVYS